MDGTSSFTKKHIHNPKARSNSLKTIKTERNKYGMSGKPSDSVSNT